MPVVEQLVGVAKIKYDRSGLIQAMRGMRAFEKRAKAMADRVNRSFMNATKIRFDREGLTRASKSFRSLETRSKKAGDTIKKNLSRGFKGIPSPRQPRARTAPRRRSRDRGGGGLLGGLSQGLGVGAGFIGITSAVQGIGSLVSGAVRFNAEMQRTKIALSTVVSAVDKIPLDQARAKADGIFAKVQKDAVRSTATTQELFGVLQGIAGPLRGAGKEYDNIRKTALDTVNAAQVLNIDLPQAARDIKQITTGRAGVDVRLFSELKAMNLITEDAKTFNKLAPDERVNKIQKALKEAGKGAPAFSRSWAGITSTLEDIFEILLNKVAGPILESITKGLTELADFLIDNQKAIGDFFDKVGKSIGVFVEKASEIAKRKSVWVAALVALGIPLAALAVKATIAAAPFIALGAVLGGIFLIVEDLITAFNGGESAIGAMLDRALGIGTTERIVRNLKAAFNELKFALEPLGEILGAIFGAEQKQAMEDMKIVWQAIGFIIETMTAQLRSAARGAGLLFSSVRDAGRALGLIDGDGNTRRITRGGGGTLPTGGGASVNNITVNRQGDQVKVDAASADAQQVASALTNQQAIKEERFLRDLSQQVRAGGGKL